MAEKGSVMSSEEKKELRQKRTKARREALEQLYRSSAGKERHNVSVRRVRIKTT